MLSKGNSWTYKHLDQKGAIFQGSQGLEKTVMNFKYLQALPGPVRTLKGDIRRPLEGSIVPFLEQWVCVPFCRHLRQ